MKARSKLVCSLKQLMIELSTTYGPSCVSYDTGRRKFAACKEIVSKMKEIIEGDARFTVCDIA